MTNTLSTKTRIAGHAIWLSVAAATAMVGFAAAANAGPHAPSSREVGMHGDPAAAARYWRYQQQDYDCAEMAVADVVGQITGDEPSEQRITALAESTPSGVRRGPIWNLTADTDIKDLPVLLAQYRIKADNIQTSIDELEHNLAERRRIIVIVNAETIWNRPGNRNAANHFVVVTGIDPKAGVVHLNDSGILSGRDEQVPIATFELAWAPNHNSAIVTR